MLLLWKVHRSSSRQLGEERLERGARWEERQGSGGDEDNQGWLLELGDQPGNSDELKFDEIITASCSQI